ncbi:MAG: RHS repeat-associated core domain-containing protein, partial [Saprospiraceae bacterium]
DRIQSKTLPSGLVMQYEYDAYSHLKRIYTGSTTYVNVDEVNGRGQITKYTSGNGKQSIHDYFHGIPTRYRTSDGAFDYHMDWDYHNGNLKMRSNQYGSKDTMSYDILDRLYTYTSTNLIGSMRRDTVSYQANGNIQKKSDVGTYAYDPVRIHAISEVTNPAGVIRDPEQDISYNSFLQPTVIEEANYRLEYTYGYHGNRIKSVLKKDGQVVETKYYLGEYEKLINATGTHFVQYVDLGGQLIAIIDSDGNTHTPHYTYTDHLGSIVMVTDAAGNIEAEQSFDPWGRRRDGQHWEYINENLPLDLPVWLYRGYTGHEHLPQFHLINMNGRLYDPALGRMLSPDNIIQDGGYSQNYNRYSYTYNNPLKYTDPDGNEIISLLLSAGISVVSNGLNNLSNGKPFFEGAGKAFAIGLIGGVFAIGIGDIAGTIANVYLRAGFQAVAHGYFSGVFSEAQGGTFRNGFTGGAISSLASSGAQSLKLGPAATIAVGGMSGGLSAIIGGGNVWQALRQGFIIGALNHVLHESASGGPDDGIWDFQDQLSQWKSDVRAGKIASAESINAYITPLENFVFTTTGRTNVTGTDISNYEGMIGTAMLTMVPVGRALSWVFRAKGSFVVYQGLDAAGKVRYVGITGREAAIRFTEHMNSGTAKALLDFKVIKGATGLSTIQARILEQSLINRYGLMRNGGQLYNIR